VGGIREVILVDSTTWMAIFTGVVGVSTVCVALFTYRLWKATQDYARVTKKLLEQTEAAFNQSKEAFEDEKRALQRDATYKIVSSAVQLDTQFMAFHVQAAKKPDYVRSFVSGTLEILNEIDPSTYKKTAEALKRWIETPKGKIYKWMFEGELDKRGTYDSENKENK